MDLRLTQKSFISLTILYERCSLSVQRLRTSQEKKEAQAKASRREIATLLERGKVETARIKVENSMSRSDLHWPLKHPYEHIL